MRPRLHAMLCLLALSAGTASAQPDLYISRPDSLLALESMRVVVQLELPPSRDMALSPTGELLLLGNKGALRRFIARDSLQVSNFAGDLAFGDWPLALAADGRDWLLLVQQSRSLQRLGPRGEALDRMLIPELQVFWRGLAVDRSGRIWLAEESGGDLLLLSRGGEVLQHWELERRLPGFRGPVLAWCTDGSGGIYLAEGWPPRMHHLNGAGNRLASWDLTLDAASFGLAPLPRAWRQEGVLLVASDGEGKVALASWGSRRHVVLEPSGKLWVLQSED